MKFYPKEVIFCPTNDCNLSCSHCFNVKTPKILPVKTAEKFLHQCRSAGIDRVGFSGGEPFKASEFLCKLSRTAVSEGMLFGNITTNGVWYSSEASLRKTLCKLYDAGYDGSICLSVDFFHKQDIGKVTCFIKTALSIWRRPDLISIACVVSPKYDARTRQKLGRLADSLKCRLESFDTSSACIKGPQALIRIFKIKLSGIGRAGKLADAWGRRWFREDHCEGPGNIFFVEPSGDVKPCCGYASGREELTIGNIERHSAGEILLRAKKNRFVSTIFRSGLSSIRRRLEISGVKFPGRAEEHCYFCHYILEKVSREVLFKCLDR